MDAILIDEDSLNNYVSKLEQDIAAGGALDGNALDGDEDCLCSLPAAGGKCPECGQAECVCDRQGDSVLKRLTTALADEWLAAYQYWTCKNLARGEGRADSVDEFDQHFKEELEHADKIMLRLNELGGKPISDPACWAASANPWTAVETADVCRQLAITRKAEEDAIAYYTECVEFCRKVGDEVTKRLFQQLLADECEHKYDLEMLIGEHCSGQ